MDEESYWRGRWHRVYQNMPECSGDAYENLLKCVGAITPLLGKPKTEEQRQRLLNYAGPYGTILARAKLAHLRRDIKDETAIRTQEAGTAPR